MNLQDIKQQIANACIQKEAKGFKSRLVYSPMITIFPDCWSMNCELCAEPELDWKDLNIANKCFHNAINSGSKSQDFIRISTSTQTEERVNSRTVHDSYQDQYRAKESPCKDKRDFGESHRASNKNLCRGSLGDYRDPVDNSRKQRVRKREVSSPEKDFKTAAELFHEENEKQNGSGLRKIVTKKSKFISPLLNKSNEGKENSKENIDERLKNVDPNMVTMIRNEIMDKSHPIAWDDIAGLEHAKKSIKEIVVWPMLRPDLFHGIRGPPKGLLLFGPPGTGKTLIGKCIASQCKATFFSISSSSLTSKWVGEGEKMVRALFAVARVQQPSVIFVDEIDSLLTQRLEGEQEATRRIKTEFLVQFDGVGTDSEDRILLIGATNRPQEIDEAARRRFRKKLYIPLPEDQARQVIVQNLLQTQNHSLTAKDIEEIVVKTRAPGYSGSDMDGLVREAAIGPLRDITDIEAVSVTQVRPILSSDFTNALLQVRASVSQKDLDLYREFDKSFGSLG